MAADFRSSWPTTNQNLLRVKESLEELRQRVAVINQDIMRAGGNA